MKKKNPEKARKQLEIAKIKYSSFDSKKLHILYQQRSILPIFGGLGPKLYLLRKAGNVDNYCK